MKEKQKKQWHRPVINSTLSIKQTLAESIEGNGDKNNRIKS